MFLLKKIQQNAY